ncbi:MAG: M43 family zinc metalloprotease, partial [Bacteroidia bacterium]
MKKLILALIVFVFYTNTALSQKSTVNRTKSNEKAQGHCATDNLHISLSEQSTSYKRKFDEMNTSYQKWAMEKNTGNKLIGGNNSTQAFQHETLPVVFHMMVNTSVSSLNPSFSATDGNLTKPQIQAALAILNQLYAGIAVGSKTIAGANTDIQFCLAEVDNFGNAITSYTYTDASFTLPLDNTNQPQITALSNFVQSTGKFPPTKYINIYVVEDIAAPAAGFAYMPPAHGSSFDGIYIEAQYLLPPVPGPNDLTYNMTVLTHEVGHYLGMFHTFGLCNTLTAACSCYNNNCLFDGDMVCDTPPDFSQDPTVGGCLTPTNTCTSDVAAIGDFFFTGDISDLTNNYMDYGDWNCQYSFTTGQIRRMHFMIDDSIGPRNSLLHSSVCNTLCANSACTVNINSLTTTSVSSIQLLNSLILSGPNVTYTFTGTTCNAFYDTFNWSVIDQSNNTVVQVGTGATFPTTFTALGNYQVQLTSSIAGSSPLCFQTATLNIQVLPPANCPTNLDMTAGWNSGSWRRIKYEGGWSRTTDNGTSFTHATTTVTPL